ncbi:FecR domain-containing protein [Steroidobacter sp. S1-65]|uniref:FecR domain-containing protein n=1 Tax=Steroidobacter gossypii TaxID=2805490 RepID=A0ABS1WZR1_9GAMM|nr:FecR domain-containing protein [Steroidobacter gossypii]MBM0106453.1 FecR domain-containing protein [Steroidobacter gossypii]
MNWRSKNNLLKLARLGLTPKEKWRRNIAVCCIVLATSVGLAYTLGAWNAIRAFVDRGAIVQIPTRVNASASTLDSAYQITSDEGGTQTFEDGTDVEYAAHTTVEVDFSAGRRVVRLRAGSATFNVAKDPRRPFIVLADGLSATAVGTKFDVTVTPTVRVRVYEGVVAVAEGQVKAGQMVRKLKAGEEYERPR